MKAAFYIFVVIVILAAAGAGYYFGYDVGYEKAIEDKTGREDTGNESEKSDLIRVTSPRPNQVISSPLVVSGEARGYWFFEASFPVRLVDANGKNIPLNPSYIMATGGWMTEEFVPFEATLTFESPGTKTGTLIFQKDNPSGLLEYDDSLAIPIGF